MGSTTNDESTFDVCWEKPQPLLGAKADAGHVLYQLTGSHSVYGVDTLLYIGQTVRGAIRINEHYKLWAELEPDDVQVRFASVEAFVDWKTWNADKRHNYPAPDDESLVKAIEGLLIYAHQPTYNIYEKRDVQPLNGKDFRIFNTGRYGRLLPELSSRRYIDVPRSPDDPR